MLDANELERMAKERPDKCFLKGSGVLKLTGGIRQLEAQLRIQRDLMLLAASDLESWMKSHGKDLATQETVKRLRDAALGVKASDQKTFRKP
jgi:hypothetical protein